MPIWEDRWADTAPPYAPEKEALDADERKLALDLWSHIRFLAGYRTNDDANPYLIEDELGNYTADPPEIDHNHSSAWITIQHYGPFWEVSWGSREFSSSFSTIGRGRTLAEAYAAAERRQ